MPIYEYRCKACGKEFEKITSWGKPDSEITCPACGKNECKRKISLFSSPGIKGGGGSCESCSSGSCSHCHG